jgi:hypothetical protein
MAATLDGIVEGNGAVFEAKFMLPWSFSEVSAAGGRLPSARAPANASISDYPKRKATFASAPSASSARLVFIL